jgi:hypothetical protein
VLLNNGSDAASIAPTKSSPTELSMRVARASIEYFHGSGLLQNQMAVLLSVDSCGRATWNGGYHPLMINVSKAICESIPLISDAGKQKKLEEAQQQQPNYRIYTAEGLFASLRKELKQMGDQRPQDAEWITRFRDIIQEVEAELTHAKFVELYNHSLSPNVVGEQLSERVKAGVLMLYVLARLYRNIVRKILRKTVRTTTSFSSSDFRRKDTLTRSGGTALLKPEEEKGLAKIIKEEQLKCPEFVGFLRGLIHQLEEKDLIGKVVTKNNKPNVQLEDGYTSLMEPADRELNNFNLFGLDLIGYSTFDLLTGSRRDFLGY